MRHHRLTATGLTLFRPTRLRILVCSVTPAGASATVEARPLAELVADIKRALAGVPGGWIEAEVLQVTRKGPHCYLSLSGGEDVRVDAKFFGHARSRAEHSLGGPMEAGQRLLVKVDRPDFYAPYGRLSLLCSDAMHIGEGELLRRRQAIVERLQRDGLVDRPRRAIAALPAQGRAGVRRSLRGLP